MKINFLLPCISRVPVGGYKVALEYANRMALDGISVTIIYPIETKINTVKNFTFKNKVRTYKKAFTKRLKQKYSSNVWFKLEKGVKEKVVPYLGARFVPDADCSIATAWETAEWLNDYGLQKGKKLYLIQDFEEWSGTKDEIENTWKFPFQKIVIAKWLQDTLSKLGQKSVLIRNGLDFNKFTIKNPIEKRSPASIIMLYHYLETKGSKDGLAALEIVKKQIPDIIATVFSTQHRPDFIPSWVHYHQKPSNLEDLYNQSAIFISPSLVEGWGLPRSEAMQCGCATILTDIGGHRDYGEPGKDFILTPVQNPAAMAEAIVKLIQDHELRIQIAKSGNNVIQQFTWEVAYQQFKQVLLTK